MTPEQWALCEAIARSTIGPTEAMRAAIRAALDEIDAQARTIATLDLALRDRDEELARQRETVKAYQAATPVMERMAEELELLRMLADAPQCELGCDPYTDDCCDLAVWRRMWRKRFGKGGAS